MHDNIRHYMIQRIFDLRNDLERERRLRQRAEYLLEGLTPGGSEFHDSPKRCAEWVQERLDFWHKKAIEEKRRADRAEARATELEEE